MKNKGGVGWWNIPQLASSELSWQSLSPSQMYAGFVQIPVSHWNWPGLHLNSAVERHMHKCAFITHLFVMLQGENVYPTIHITHGSWQARRIGRHSRPLCHTSTRTGYTCRSCRQTDGRFVGTYFKWEMVRVFVKFKVMIWVKYDVLTWLAVQLDMHCLPSAAR